jgi:acyl-CoA synthetase (AMP-forming)/AMP-acid ligase II
MLDVRSAMRRTAGFNRDRIAVKSLGRELTFGESWDRGVRLANALLGMGLAEGDRVAVLEDNCVEAADFYVGSVAANLVRVPLYRRNSSEAHEHMIRHTGAKVVVVSEEFAPELAGLTDRIEGLRLLVRDKNYEDWLFSHSNVDPDPEIALDDVFIIRHSAGTTGRAKGIAYSHRAWMSATRDWFYQLPPVDLGDRCLHVGPISHGSGYLFLPVWLGGGCNVLFPRFDAQTVLEALSAEPVSYFFAVPTMVADLSRVAGGQRLDLPALKAVMVSGAPISERTALAGHEVFGDTMYQMYGQTEAVPVTFMGPRTWFSQVPGSTPIRAAGQVMPFAELQIRDEDGAVLPIGAEGEISIRCDGQMSGIWDDEELTARRLRDGWVLTGDIGRLDENGFLYVVDRVDDLIVSGGFNIWPAELEQVIGLMPPVREVTVFGVPDEKWGETPMALVVVDDLTAIEEAAIIEECRVHLGSYKKPTLVEFRTEPLPRSPVGKIQRKVLREPYWSGQGRRVGGS